MGNKYQGMNQKIDLKTCVVSKYIRTEEQYSYIYCATTHTDRDVGDLSYHSVTKRALKARGFKIARSLFPVGPNTSTSHP